MPFDGAMASSALGAEEVEEEVAIADANELDAFVRDSSAVPLPSFDDFRRKEQQQLASPPQSSSPFGNVFGREGEGDASGAARPRSPSELTPQELARDRLFELLSFDTIDERPVNEDPYDWTARLIGRGLPNKAGVYLLPYLQTGHLLLVGVLLLSTLISYPGFPLTEVPDSYRAILAQGIGITYLINSLTAVYAFFVAGAKGEPATFWAIKCFLLGGLALSELTQAVPERKPESYKERQARNANRP